MSEKQFAGEASHEELKAVCSGDDYGWTSRTDRPDCSSGCRFFHPLEGARGYDWGVCHNPQSVRAGLLTFEHMGCEHFEYDPTGDDE